MSAVHVYLIGDLLFLTLVRRFEQGEVHSRGAGKPFPSEFCLPSCHERWLLRLQERYFIFVGDQRRARDLC